MDTEILHVNELLDGYAHSLAGGGEIRWDALGENGDGTQNLRLAVMTDQGEMAIGMPLATMTVSELYPAMEPALFTREIFGQLMQGGESFF